MLVIIDVKPKDLGLPTEAYISVEEVHDVSILGLPCTANGFVPFLISVSAAHKAALFRACLPF